MNKPQQLNEQIIDEFRIQIMYQIEREMERYDSIKFICQKLHLKLSRIIRSEMDFKHHFLLADQLKRQIQKNLKNT